MSHGTLKEIQHVFENVEVRNYWLGMIFIIAAT